MTTPPSERFILRAAPGAQPAAQALGAQLQQHTGLQLLDCAPRMLLVAGSQATLDEALQHCSGWSVSAETHSPLPDTRARVRRPAGGG